MKSIWPFDHSVWEAISGSTGSANCLQQYQPSMTQTDILLYWPIPDTLYMWECHLTRPSKQHDNLQQIEWLQACSWPH